MSTKPPSKSVFIGNIPYGLTEEQIVRLFSSAGKVLNFRLVYDRETGRPKGFGFAEYPDSDSAASAVRNLNDYEIMNRKLRVDYSNDAPDDSNDNPMSNTQPPTYHAPPSLPVPPPNGYSGPPPPITNSTLPPLPLGIDLPAGLTCPDAISRTLNTLPPAQLLDVLSQMKTLASTDPSKATELLHQAPQLSYAIFQALLLMGLVSTDALSSVVEQASATSAPAPIPTPMQNQQYPVPPPGSFGAGYPPPPPTGLAIQTSTPPVRGAYAPPPQQVPPPPAQQSQPAGNDTEALMQQVLAMPQELIDQLPPAERAQIMALRAGYGR